MAGLHILKYSENLSDERLCEVWAENSYFQLQEPSEALAAKTAHLKEKIARIGKEMKKLETIERQMVASPDQQISLTDPDSRSMATSGHGSGMVGYVQIAVDTEHHLFVAHDVTNAGHDRAQLANMAGKAK